LPEIGVVAVDVGPGLFTGMRVGIATAKAMASALEIPVITSTSLELLALPFVTEERVIVSIVDARKGEVFFAMYRGEGREVREVLPPSCGPIDAVVAAVQDRGQSVLVVGDGARRYHDALMADHRVEIAGESFDHPSADTLVGLAHRRSLVEAWVTAESVEAMYLRQPDAEINWTTRADKS
jgi:tRNA threonylcarbamoyladenosine biosynthesis protein TsaB